MSFRVRPVVSLKFWMAPSFFSFTVTLIAAAGLISMVVCLALAFLGLTVFHSSAVFSVLGGFI
jgi:hypothetical protein